MHNTKRKPTRSTLPTLKFSATKSVDVNKGMATNWKRCFKHDDIRVPEGWVHALEINGRMYSFSFVKLTNATKCADGEYICVIDKFGRDEVLGQKVIPFPHDETYYLLDVMVALRPQDDGRIQLVDHYLADRCVVYFKKSTLEKARREKKIQIN
jgi:hypothetical protein